MAKSAVGIEILKGKQPKWRVGKILGTGACAVVHQLENIDGSPTDFAIKITPIPKKTTKKGNSKEETDVRLLYYESVVYQNQFPDLQGTIVPKLPPSKGPSAHGKTEDFAYFCMERMARPLGDIVTLLTQGRKKNDGTIAFGPIASRLISCVEAIHERKHVVVDIKPDNFMLSVGDDRKVSADHIASRIRILDLALVQSWASVASGSHRTNDGNSALVGTPLYSSLNVHNGETLSRRDDLEALGYVIAELLIQLSSGDTSKQLPWSVGKSDVEIASLKESHVTNPNSDFYKNLGGGSVAEIFFQFISEVRGYSFKKIPDYKALKEMLMGIKVPVSVTAKPAASNKRQSTRTTRATRGKPKEDDTAVTTTTSRKRVTRSRASAKENEESPAKIRRDETMMETEVINVDSDEESFQNARQGENDESFVTAMEWELTDENQEPSQTDDQKPAAVEGLTVVVENGPHKGERIDLIMDESPSYLVGRNPTLSHGEHALVLSNDEKVDRSHIRLVLCKIKKVLSVKVTDLKSSTGSFVGSEKIRKGKDFKLYRGQSVQIGNSLLSVHTLNAGNMKAPPKPAAANKKQKSRNKDTGTAADVPEELPRLKRKGVALFVEEGPHQNESFELEHGGIESLVLGSKPSGNGGNVICLERDSHLKSTHLKIDLVIQKKLTCITVTDKSKGCTWINRDKVKSGSRAFINDQIKIGDTVLRLRPL